MGDALPPELDWLKPLDAILPAKFPQSDFDGDEPARKPARNSEPGAADEEVAVVIVGGGISGLAAAYILRESRPIILEQAASFGGTARGESWEGVEYSIGGARLAMPAADSELLRRFYEPLGLAARWRVSGGGAVIASGTLRSAFWTGATAADLTAKAQIKKVHEYLRSLRDRAYPGIPPKESGKLPAALVALDMKSLLTELESAAGGKLAQPLRAAVEHTCWAALGGGPAEISAASGLHVLASGLEGACVLPGGNAKVASSLLRATAAAGVPSENFRVSSAVYRITPRGGGALVQWRRADGSEHAILAKAVVVACPKLVAKDLVAGLPTDQLDAMNALTYRACLVANALLDGPLPLDPLDVGLRGTESETFQDVKAAASRQKATAVVGYRGGRSRSVLTMYRAFPFDGGQAQLHRSGAFPLYRDEFVAQLKGVLKALSYGGAVPPADKVRVARWANPLVLAAPGLIATGTVQKAAATVADRIFFCNQDDWALPTIETCLTSALRVAQQIEGVIA